MSERDNYNIDETVIDDKAIETNLLNYDKTDLQEVFAEIADPSISDSSLEYTNSVPSISFKATDKIVFSFRQYNTISVGREDRARNINPDLDLKSYFGYELGVSRHHARIVYYQGNYHVIDLGSANGSKINGKRLKANEMYPIHEKDVICFGMFQLTVTKIYHPIMQ